MSDAAAMTARPRRRFTTSGAIGMAIVGFWLLIALFGPMLAPHDVGQVIDLDVFSPASMRFPLGSDYLGRDMLSRILTAGRYTVAISFIATLVAAGVGVAAGLAAASGGWLDTLLSRVFDTVIAIPSMMFGLVVITSLGPSVPVLIGTLAVIYMPGAFRTARALALNVAMLDFVTVARARGERLPHIVFREILPNVTGPLAADFGVRFVYVVLLLSGLSFLGVGLQPPYADLGALVRENIAGLGFGAPAVLFPAVAIASLTIGVNMLIDALPDHRGRGKQ
ncbi:peptide/nickel transport system permease protein [Sphingomonas sp. YR710]|uniref:ABC transporter permease n=1 Tax=Sphingomonas sp. YR710 TaxID=1882773 RepID=UPI0008859A69|nr:ABC transporter permease [Sphingomonas sp. YR710]SDD26323.1 peptide/nickel transport system permease protein [Sphingomonas sp. YR710]